MLRKLVLGLGAAGLVGSSAVGQFASDRAAPKAPVPFGGLTPAPAAPAAPGGYVPPVGGFTPAGAAAPAPMFTPQPAQPPAAAEPLDIPTALGPNHPMALRPEHGPFMILVRSYSRPARPDPANPGMSAKDLAVGLAEEIKKLPQAKGLGVYLFEHISEERRAEAQAAAAARKRAAEFTAAMDKLRHTSELNGMEFLGGEQKLRYKTFNYRDQIGVMVGGFRTEDEAVRAMAKVKTWPTPADTRLLDGGAIARQGTDGKATIEKTFLNPYGQAMVVANPTIPRPQAAPGTVPQLDPFIVKLNEGRPYNLLNATKTWTLGVKAFNAPVRVQTRDDDGVGIKLFNFTKTGDILNAGAEAAEQMAKGIRAMTGPEPDFRPLNLEAFVLHHRSGSMVTVGQFDGPTDPALHETRRLLQSLNFQARDPRVMESTRNYLHETIVPIPIPKP